MALILSIETATPVCAVALHEHGRLLGEIRLLKDKSHSGKLAPVIQNLVKDCDFEMQDLSAIAVSEGPGSYTGMRIGVSTAKGLCYGLKVPLIAINTLTAMAAQIEPFIGNDDVLIPMLDARRMEVYCIVHGKNLQLIRETEPVVIDENSFGDLLQKNKCYIFGDGAPKCKEVLVHPNVFFIDDVYPSASTIGQLAYQKFRNKKFEDVAYFEPYYLKEYKAGKPKSLV